jgi:hypothetical protein
MEYAKQWVPVEGTLLKEYEASYFVELPHGFAMKENGEPCEPFRLFFPKKQSRFNNGQFEVNHWFLTIKDNELRRGGSFIALLHTESVSVEDAQV